MARIKGGKRFRMKTLNMAAAELEDVVLTIHDNIQPAQ